MVVVIDCYDLFTAMFFLVLFNVIDQSATKGGERTACQIVEDSLVTAAMFHFATSTDLSHKVGEKHACQIVKQIDQV